MVLALRLAVLLALLMPAHAMAQGRTPEACHAEIQRTELRIAAARKMPEYRNEQGRYVLSAADRWVNQARKHAAKGESRGCVEAAQKGLTQLSAR